MFPSLVERLCFNLERSGDYLIKTFDVGLIAELTSVLDRQIDQKLGEAKEGTPWRACEYYWQ